MSWEFFDIGNDFNLKLIINLKVISTLYMHVYLFKMQYTPSIELITAIMVSFELYMSFQAQQFSSINMYFNLGNTVVIC